MAGRGRIFSFHGSFGTKARAVRKEKQLKRRGHSVFIRKVKIKGRPRWSVLSRRAR